MKVIQLSTGMYVKQLNPFVLTSIDEEAEEFNDSDVDGIIADLELSEGESFGRPDDRHGK